MLQNIFLVNKIAPDKWRHFFAGILMGAILQAFLLFLLPDHPILAAVIALILVMAVSYGFELVSKFSGRGVYDVMDAVASTLGGLVGMLAPLLYKTHLFLAW